MFFNQYPYINENDLNLDFLLRKIRELDDVVKQFINTETLKFADPILWDISKQYAKGTIVLDELGNAHLSKTAVPAGIELDDDRYWLEIFNFADYVRTANENLTLNIEQNTTRASRNYVVGDWIIWNDVLYRATTPIAFDDLFVHPGNLEHFTVENFIKEFMLDATNRINQYKNEIDASELAFTSNILEQFNQAVAGVTVDSEILLARVEYNGYTAATLADSITDQSKNLGLGVETLNKPNENLFDLFDTTDPDFLTGYGFQGSTGNIVASTTGDITGYIKMIFGDVLRFYWRNNLVFDNTLSEVVKVAFYDSQKRWLKTVNIQNAPFANGEIIADSDGYVRIHFQNDRTVTDYHLYNSRVGITQQLNYDYCDDSRFNHNGYTPFACEWKYGTYAANGTSGNTRGKKRVYLISNEINDGSVVCFVPNKYNVMFRTFPTPIGAQIGSSSQTQRGNLLLTDYGLPKNARQIYIQIDGLNNEDLELSDIYKDFAIYNKPKTVDLFIFSGQSNMAGRGASSSGVDRCAGYEFRAISDPTRLYPIVDPFGVNENVSGAIDDGSAKTGSCVPYFVQAYYRTCAHTVVAISASDGGTGIDDWQKNTARYNDLIQRYNDCVAYLTANGYTINRQFLIWHQGEHDRAMTPTEYENKLIAFADDIRTDTSIEYIGILRVGSTTTYPNPNVIEAQTRLCESKTTHGCIMLYTLCANYNALGYMKSDDLHYNQSGLDLMGTSGGNNLGYYVNNRKRPMMKDLYYNNIYAPLS